MVLAAPDGYGKSTLVRDVVRTRDHVWVAIDADARDLLGVLRSFADALHGVAPGFAATFVAVYDRLGDAPDAPQQLATWAAEHIASIGLTLVVDGIARDVDERVWAFVTGLVDRTIARNRWIIIVERLERLPVARWMAEATMDLPLDETDLALSEDDLRKAALDEASPWSRAELDILCQCSGGWPAAIALGLTACESIDRERAPAEPAAFFAYVAEMLLVTLSPGERAFIDATSLFDGFDAALVECTGLRDARRVAAALCDEIGILGLDANGVYRYSAPFKAFLRERLRTAGDAHFDELASATARAYERAGREAGALAIYVEAGDHRAVGALLSASGFRLMERGESGAVERALRALPQATLDDFPVALAVKAALESLHGRLDVAEAWFRLALEAIGDGAQRDEIVYRLAIDLVRRERRDAIDVLEPALKTIDEGAPFAAPLFALLASAHASQREFTHATLAIERALMLLPRVVDRTMRAKVLHQAAFVAFCRGDIAGAKAFATQAYDEATAAYAYDMAARALSVLYNIAIDHDDDLVASRDYLARLAERSVLAGSRQLLLYATSCQYELEVRAGNVGEIARLAERLRSLEVFFSVLTTETLLPAAALQATWTGDFFGAYRLLEPSADSQISPDRQARRYAEIALYAAAAGFRERASAAADRALRLVREIGTADATLLHTQAAIALTFVLLRRRARAAKLLDEVVRRAAGSARLTALVDAVTLVAERWAYGVTPLGLGAALERLAVLDLGGYARMIESLPLPETGRGSIARLTATERDTLRRLAAGLNPRAVARVSGRNLPAVRRQIASVCRKLGCTGWRHAVAMARDEGLLGETICEDAMGALTASGAS